MTITLKNLKVAEFASEETTCFSATVYLHGKRMVGVKNDGHGGCHMFGMVGGNGPKDLDRRMKHFSKNMETLMAIAAKRDKIDLGFGGGADFQPDIEWLVSEALTDALDLKDMRRTLKKAVVGIRAGETDMRTWRVKADNYGIARVKHHNPGVRLLNEMSEADALSLWKEMG